MSNDSKTEHTLNDLIAIARDGHEFYTDAAQKVGDAELAALFTRIAGVKSSIVSKLGATVQAAGGDPEDDGTMVGGMQQLYGRIRAALGDKEYGYVAELEESEDRLLKAFKDTIADSDTSPTARAAAQELLPQVTECHNTMRDRKLAMKNAH